MKLFATITALLGALGLLSLRLGADAPKALPDITLTEVQIVGSRYVYICDGTEITEKEYKDFGKKNALDKMREFMQRYKIPMK